MVRLKVRDLRALLDFVRRCSATQNLDDLVTALTSGLAKLIPADVTSYAEADLQSRRIRQTNYLGLLLSLFLALGIALGAPSAAWAQCGVIGPPMPWTTIASAGTADEASLNNVILEGSFATLRAQGTATIRYNIVVVDG